MLTVNLNINSFYKEDATNPAGWYDEDNNFYKSPMEFIQSSLFDSCGCGNMKINLEYIRDGLQHLSDLTNKVWEDAEWSTNHSKLHKQWEEDGISRIFGSERSMNFFWYYLDKNILSEHGGSIPGWLTDWGESLLCDLNFIVENYDELEKQFS